jgi:hypothetical protein
MTWPQIVALPCAMLVIAFIRVGIELLRRKP